jgi:hypothetical protein
VGDTLDEEALKALLHEAVLLNVSRVLRDYVLVRIVDGGRDDDCPCVLL